VTHTEAVLPKYSSATENSTVDKRARSEKQLFANGPCWWAQLGWFLSRWAAREFGSRMQLSWACLDAVGSGAQMSKSNNTAEATRGTLLLLVLSICGATMAVGLFVTGIVDIWAGRWFGSGGGFASAVAGAFLGLATLRIVGLWRQARGLSRHTPA
jgi:hypothetical protein